MTATRSKVYVGDANVTRGSRDKSAESGVYRI